MRNIVRADINLNVLKKRKLKWNSIDIKTHSSRIIHENTLSLKLNLSTMKKIKVIEFNEKTISFNCFLSSLPL